jgi:uroporphyrinogen III methyltransferase/synthase
LLTLRAAELLRQAEVVVYDGLVNPSLLRLADPRAEVIYGGKHDRSRAVSQEALNALLVAKARAGRRVVRLKGGDPYVLGRGGEEAQMLADAGIPFEVVPGVSSAEAAPNYAGIPLTHRDYGSSYTVVTGHEDPARETFRSQWARLALTPGTLVVLMGLKRLRPITASLLAHGRSPETPVALIRWATVGRQQVLEGTLRTIADQAEQTQLAPPVVIVIGEVVKLRSRLNWFERRPLFGRRVVVTQAQGQSEELTRRLQEHGAEVLEVPAMRFTPPSDPEPLRQALTRLKGYDWILFSSPTSVTSFWDAFFAIHRDWRELGPARLGAYGPQTAAKLQAMHLAVAAIPAGHQGPAIAEALSRHGALAGRRILLLRPEGASPKVPGPLRQQGAMVEEVACYRAVVATDDRADDAASLAEHGADWITFAGYPEVTFFHRRFDLVKLLQRFPHLRLATIGP